MMRIDPERRGKLPPVEDPTVLVGMDGAPRGWCLQLPNKRPLPTPAVDNGRLFVGGGYGSYDFYCLDAGTGKLDWQYQTRDDGPTAAVVVGGYVVFNTESCELEVLSVTGNSVWKHWLGDPLMSMPAVAGSRVFMAYPDTRADGEHFLACFGLGDGRQLWRSRIPGEIISAPILADTAVYFATLDGTLMCFGQETGELRWQEKANATSSPVVVDGHCYFSQRKEKDSGQKGAETYQTEHCASRKSRQDAETRAYASTSRKAAYLNYRKRRGSSAKRAAMSEYDSAVGFAFAKGSSKMHQAILNLGYETVAGVWSYQGSKPFFWSGRLYSSMGDTVHCIDADSGAVIWKRNLYDEASEELVDSVVTPPALANKKVFVANAKGNVFTLSAETGDVLWQDDVKAPVDFQLAVVRGCVYVPTRNGKLFCLETGDMEDDGWAMWGATPEHNGLPPSESRT